MGRTSLEPPSTTAAPAAGDRPPAWDGLQTCDGPPTRDGQPAWDGPPTARASRPQARLRTPFDYQSGTRLPPGTRW